MGRVRAAGTAVTGRARLDRRTKDLVRRLRPGEIAVIDHPDLDRVAAEALVAAGAAAVVNAAPSITGRYPNGGPIRVVRAGIPLVDEAGEAVFTEIREGDEVRVDGGEVWVGDRRVATGRRREAAEVEAAMEAAKANIGAELERFAANTLEYIRTEAHGTFEPVRLPPLRTEIRGRHALVVVRGHDYRDDLRALRAYIREFRPVLIGVDGGADALLDAGLRPDLFVGDFDSLSERGWRCGAQLIHHVHRDGRAPGREHLVARGVAYDEIVMDGTSEDVAMILAYEAGASLIVAVGTHATMVEFLDKGRRGMSSTFLTRLRLGPVLVDAKGVSRLYEGRVRRRDVYALIAAALVAMLVVTIVSEPLHVFLDGVRLTLEELWYALTGRS